MQDFSKFPLDFWRTIAKKYKGNTQAQLIAAYLFGCDHTNMIGVFYCPVSYISQDLGSPLEGAYKGLQDLLEGGFCTYDYENDIVWVHDIAKLQIGDKVKASDNKASWIISEFQKLLPGHIKQGFYKRYKESFNLPIDEQLELEIKENEARNISPLEGASKGLRYIDIDVNINKNINHNQEIEKEREKGKEGISEFIFFLSCFLPKQKREPKIYPAERFQDFFTIYPRREVQKKALAVWKKMNLDLEADQIIEDVKNRIQHSWDKGFYPLPTTYLNRESWKYDEITTRAKADKQLSLEEYRAAIRERTTYTSYEPNDDTRMDSQSVREIQDIDCDEAGASGDNESKAGGVG